MSGVTGIELGPNFSVLVRGGRAGSHRTVAAASAIMPSAWPGDPHALADRLREARQRNEFSQRARVVAWGEDVALAPLVEAGFEVVSVLSPAQALARVVRARKVDAPPGTAIAALSLNTHGAVIAIVAGTEVIQSRVVEWTLGTPFVHQRCGRGARSELLDRYLLVSQIAPQLQHVIDLVRPVYGVTVTSVVACGNLPNLRSLAMLLIEEMDMEVETLDSAELLDPTVAPGTLADTVASLQLAAAAASSGENRVPVHVEREAEPRASAGVEEHSQHRVRVTHVQSLAAFAALLFCTAWSFMQVSASIPARPLFPPGLIDGIAAGTGGVAAVPARPELRTEATTGRADAVERDASPDDGLTTSLPASVPKTDLRASRHAPAGRGSSTGPPLPSVEGIMISGPRRLAIVGGVVVAAGDPVGTRAIARIERDGVVLREPSGREVYVAIRPRKHPPLGS